MEKMDSSASGGAGSAAGKGGASAEQKYFLYFGVNEPPRKVVLVRLLGCPTRVFSLHCRVIDTHL